jgi:hypothetical protein
MSSRKKSHRKKRYAILPFQLYERAVGLRSKNEFGLIRKSMQIGKKKERGIRLFKVFLMFVDTLDSSFYLAMGRCHRFDLATFPKVNASKVTASSRSGRIPVENSGTETKPF